MQPGRAAGRLQCHAGRRMSAANPNRGAVVSVRGSVIAIRFEAHSPSMLKCEMKLKCGQSVSISIGLHPWARPKSKSNPGGTSIMNSVRIALWATRRQRNIWPIGSAKTGGSLTFQMAHFLGQIIRGKTLSQSEIIWGAGQGCLPLCKSVGF